MISSPLGNITAKYYPLGIFLQHLSGNLPALPVGYACDMDIYQIRLDNMRASVAIFGTRKALADRIGMTPTLLNQYIGKNPTKQIGDKTARKLDAALEQKEGFVDRQDAVRQILNRTATGTVAEDLQKIPLPGLRLHPVVVTGAIMPIPNDSTGLVEVTTDQDEKTIIGVPYADVTTRVYQIRKQGLGAGFMPQWYIAISKTDAPCPSDIILTDPDSGAPVFAEYIAQQNDGHLLLSLHGVRLHIDARVPLWRVIAIMPPTAAIKDFPA